MWKKKSSNMASPFKLLCAILICVGACIVNATAATSGFDDEHKKMELLAKKNEWRSVVSTEYGKISDVEIGDGVNGTYYLQLIVLDPNALFLPVILHADMIFYVHSGNGRVTYFDGHGEKNENKHKDKDKSQGVRLQRGDVYRLKTGTIFYMQSSLDDERQKLRVYAIFANSVGDLREPVVGPYSGIRDLVLGFDKKVLQAAFQMPEEAIEEITSAKKPPQIVHAAQNSSSRTFWEVEARLIEVFLGRNMYHMFEVNKKKKSTEVYNFFKGDRDVENCNGWSTAISSKQSPALRGSNIGLFMVNLTKGAMMGPHWNPTATEIAIVLEGEGMVNIVCLGTGRKECNNTRFMVKEGDAFVVPRHHPMAQMAFNNGSFVFVGFTTRDEDNHPQFLAGKRSVLQTLQKQVLEVAFNASNSTVSRLVEPQNDSIILECVSCAEEEEKIMKEEIEKAREKEEARAREEERKRQEEERKKQEEEKRKREEEEAKKREEEKRKQEEEEKKRREEEEARKREEEKKRKEEEEARKREEEKRKREEEEESRKREEEMERRRQEEAARKAAEEAKRRQEEEKRRREEEEAKKREEEEEMKRKKEEEERKRQEEARRREEEEEARKREAAATRKREEEMERKREEEAKRAEEAKKREEEEARRKEKEEAQQEEARKREKEKAKKEEDRRQEEEQIQQEEMRRQQETAKEAEAARKAKEDEQARQRKEQEEAKKGETEKAREEEDRRQDEEQSQQEEQKRQEAARRARQGEAKQREEEAGSAGKKKSQEEEQEQEQKRQQEEIEYQPGGPGEKRGVL